MNPNLCLVSVSLFVFLSWNAAMAQATHSDSTVTTAEVTAAQVLDKIFDFREVEVSIGELETFLQDKIEGVGVFVDSRSLELAGVNPATKIRITASKLHLRAIFRKMLQPLGLKAVVQREGLAITADFQELTRRGIATDSWLDAGMAAEQASEKQMMQQVDVAFDNVPLKDAVAHLSKLVNLPMLIDRRALEEIGLRDDQPVTIQLQNVSFRSALRLMLRDLDLDYQFEDEVLQITTIQCCESNLSNRVYFLGGIGLSGDKASIDEFCELIQRTLVPDTWEALGGPSTIVRYQSGTGRRPAIIVSTTKWVHEMIDDALSAFRNANVGPDPEA